MIGSLVALGQEIRHAIRTLGRKFGVTLLVALTIGAAAGPLTVAVGLTEPETLADHGVRSPDELVQIFGSVPRAGSEGTYGLLSFPEFSALLRHQVTLSSIAASARATADLMNGVEADRVEVGLVSEAYFELLGVKMQRGTPWRPKGDGEADEPVAVISGWLWKSAFEASPTTLGSVVTLNALRVRVIAITTDDFRGLEPGRPEALWVPISLQPHFSDDAPPLDEWEAHAFSVVGRGSDAVAISQVSDDVLRISASLETEQPHEWRGRRFKADALEGRTVKRDSAASALNRAMWLLATILLALACFNVSGILLVRALSTEHATGVRMALGLSFKRLVGGAFIQAALLSMFGGAVSWVFATWLLSAIRHRTDGGVTGTLGWEAVVGVGLVAVLFAACLIVVPALFWRRLVVSEVLATGGRTERPSARRAGNLLVALQVAMSLVVVCAALMLGRSLEKFRNVDPGFSTRGLVSVGIDLRRRNSPLEAAELIAMKHRLSRDVAAIAGVRAAGLGLMPLLLHGAAVTNDVSASGATVHQVAIDVIGPGYFDAVGVQLIAGEPIASHHDNSVQPVVVVNKAMAAAYWPNRNAVGQELAFHRRNGSKRIARVIGVVENFHGDFVGREVEPRAYKSALQEPFMIGHLYVRTDGSSQALRALERAVNGILADAPTPVTMRSVDELREESLSFLKNTFSVANALAGIALMLAIAGIFSLQSFVVERRRREFGIRLALGATSSHLIGLVLRDALFAVLGGVLVAAPFVMLSSSLFTALIPGVESFDTVVALGAFGALSVVVLSGSVWPTVQVLRVDPLSSVREL